MDALQFIDPADLRPRASICLYGEGGGGKTTNALATAPGTSLYLNLDRMHAATKARELAPGKFKEIQPQEGDSVSDVLDAIYLRVRNGDGEENVVIDTVGRLYDALLEELSSKNTGDAVGITTQANHGDVQTKIKRFVQAMGETPVNLILIAHEQIDDSEAEKMRRPMTGGKKLPEQIIGLMDIVAYCKAIDNGKDADPQFEWKAQLVQGNGRRAKPGPGDLGAVRSIDITEWLALTYPPTKTNTKEAIAA